MSNLFDDESDGEEYQAQAVAEVEPVAEAHPTQEESYNYEQPAAEEQPAQTEYNPYTGAPSED